MKRILKKKSSVLSSDVVAESLFGAKESNRELLGCG